MRLMRKGKEKDMLRWWRIPDSWLPVRGKGPCPFSLIWQCFCTPTASPFALVRSLCWKRWWWSWAPCFSSSCWVWVWPHWPWLRMTTNTDTSYPSTLIPNQRAGMTDTVKAWWGAETRSTPAKMSTPLFMATRMTSRPSVKMRMENLTEAISE